MATSSRARCGSLIFASAVALLPLVATDAGAQVGPMGAPTTTPPIVQQGGRARLFIATGPASPALAASPAPPKPVNCQAVPTLNNCRDPQYMRQSSCATEGPNQKLARDYCTWLMLEEWRKGSGATHPVSFPTAQPNTVDGPLAPGRLVSRGRNVTSQLVPGKAVERRRYVGATPTGATSPRPAVPLAWSPKNATSNNGTFGSQIIVNATPISATVDSNLEVFRSTGLSASDTNLNTQAINIINLVSGAVPGVTSGPAITTCTDYAAKRWGDYTRFSAAAKRLGRNHRAIYNLATDPSSPMFVNKEPLLQTGTSTPMPKQIREFMGSTLPVNAFFVERPTFVNTYNNVAGLDAASKQAILNLYDARTDRTISSSRGTPFGVHEDAKQRLDTAYGNPTDDELEDAARRAAAYQKLWAERFAILQGLECAKGSDPCWLCRERPDAGAQSLPGAIQKLKDRVTGNPVINPSDINVLVTAGNPAQRFRALALAHSLGPLMSGVAAMDRGAPQQPVQQQNRSKQKGLPLAQLGAAKPASTPTTPPPAAGFNACSADLANRGNQLRIALTGVERKMATLLLNESKLGARGCLANPGSNKTNLCDWNYDLFGSTVSTVLDSQVEASYEECRVEVANAAVAGKITSANLVGSILPRAEAQALIYPCVWRGNYSGDAVKAKKFMDLNGAPSGRSCEGYFQNAVLSELQAGITKELAGLEWTPDEEKIGDSENDSVEIGERSSFQAYTNYDVKWHIKSGGKKPNGSVTDTCKYDGKIESTLNAGVFFFDTDLKIFELVGKGDTKERKASLKARYRDFDTGNMRQFSDKTGGADYSLTSGAVSIPLAQPPIYLGGEEISFWIWIGPVPVKVTFGANATAGVDYKVAGVSGDNCSNMTGASGFRMESVIEPWARADAYASASLDVVVAEAGIRLDLLLLRLGIPFGLTISNTSQNEWKFNNGATVALDLLSGKVSAYAEAGVPPLEATWEETLFRWDGFHTDIPIFSLSNKTIKNKTMQIALAKSIDPTTAKCRCGGEVSQPFTAPRICCSDIGPKDGIASREIWLNAQAGEKGRFSCEYKMLTGVPSTCSGYVRSGPVTP